MSHLLDRGKFERLVVLDPIILTKDQRSALDEKATQFIDASVMSAETMLGEIAEETERNPSPMCWTQLAQQGDLTTEELERRIGGADGIITCWTSIPDSVILNNPQLRYIGFWTNLARHRINVKLARDRGIQVTYLPDYGTDSVAEMTFAGMLAVSRRLRETAKQTERGSWPYELLKTGTNVPEVDQIPQRMLMGKVLGIVGFGRIGKRVSEMARAFRMKVQYYSRNRHPELEQSGVRFASLDELFSTSDVVSLHLSPYAGEKIIDTRLISLLKDGAIFINTSAGRLIDQEALLCEIESGRIYAYLDVYEGLPPRKRLKELSNKGNLFTYRAGWFTREAVTYKGDLLIRSIEQFLSGNPVEAVWDVEPDFPSHEIHEAQASNCSEQ